MRLLALDTATEACSVALRVDEALYTRWVEAPREHGDRLLSMIDEVLAEAGLNADTLDGLAFGRGPGAFTGVRIAVSAVQGIAYGLDRPVVPVSDLAALAQRAHREYGARAVLAAIDARMGEVYWGAYRLGDEGLMTAVQEETVASPDQVPWPEGSDWLGVGTGWASYADRLSEAAGTRLWCNQGRALPDARDIVVLATPAWQRGDVVAAIDALPVYLRDRVADKPRQR